MFLLVSDNWDLHECIESRTRWQTKTKNCQLQLVAVGLIAEGAALRYDAVFSHKQIDLIFSAMSMVHQSFSTNLLIWRWLMVVNGILLVFGSFSTMLFIRRKSKFFHLLVRFYLLNDFKMLLKIVKKLISILKFQICEKWRKYVSFLYDIFGIIFAIIYEGCPKIV